MTAGLRGPSRRRPCRALCAQDSPREASAPLPINAVTHRDHFLDGTGFDKVAEGYRNAGEAHRPFIASLSDYFTLVLPNLTYINGVASSDPPALLLVPVQMEALMTRQSFPLAMRRRAQPKTSRKRLG